MLLTVLGRVNMNYADIALLISDTLNPKMKTSKPLIYLSNKAKFYCSERLQIFFFFWMGGET